MRSRFQKHKDTTYIFAGSQESLMKELFQSKKHAFYRFGRIFEVGNISRSDFSEYILKSFEGEGIKIGAEHIEAVLNFTDGHPYYTQLLCQIIYIDCLKNRKKSLSKSDILSAETEAIEHEQPLFDEIWGKLGSKKYSRNIMGLMAKGESPYSLSETTKENIARILTDLVRYGHIAKRGEGKNIRYDLRDPFFKKYVLLKLESTS